MSENSLHTILLITCVLAVAVIVSIDLNLGGDGLALSSGLTVIGAIGGVALSSITKPTNTP